MSWSLDNASSSFFLEVVRTTNIRSTRKCRTRRRTTSDLVDVLGVKGGPKQREAQNKACAVGRSIAPATRHGSRVEWHPGRLPALQVAGPVVFRIHVNFPRGTRLKIGVSIPLHLQSYLLRKYDWTLLAPTPVSPSQKVRLEAKRVLFTSFRPFAKMSDCTGAPGGPL